jgi:hypothetical protein
VCRSCSRGLNGHNVDSRAQLPSPPPLRWMAPSTAHLSLRSRSSCTHLRLSLSLSLLHECSRGSLARSSRPLCPRVDTSKTGCRHGRTGLDEHRANEQHAQTQVELAFCTMGRRSSAIANPSVSSSRLFRLTFDSEDLFCEKAYVIIENRFIYTLDLESCPQMFTSLSESAQSE